MKTTHLEIPNRRPGIDAVAKRIQQQHPNWSRQQVITQAKLEWTAKYLNSKS